jgi:hypothetical protein
MSFTTMASSRRQLEEAKDKGEEEDVLDEQGFW